ncbi:hypothetical protein [Gracilibacillus dipsosauri]|uniref:hypothetical protein n=1 Tax=Gracilibacillus dipsosauri TaxID=178340 RepID=UPI0024097A54
MSEKKKVIYVKDLVIKADNVRIEPTRRRDPLFGGARQEPQADEREHHHDNDDVREERDERHDHEEHDDHKDRDDRPPFSWL